jgi:hypothetical protein
MIDSTYKPYKAKSLNGAQRRVRQLEKQILQWRDLAEQYHYERCQLAKLASDTPQFFNPFHVTEAKQIRDRILNT